MPGRTTAVLERFPAHLGATDPGKRFRDVVDGLAETLDVLSHQLGDVRRSHRLAEAPTRLDLLRVSALHRIGHAALEPSAHRLNFLGDISAADLPALAAATAIAEDDLDGVGAEVLAASLAAATSFESRQGLARQVVRGLIEAHLVGNGTAPSLLLAAAAYLSLRVLAITHSADGWWHLARCSDLTAPALEGVEPSEDLLALEENPHRPASIEPVPRRHGDRFGVLRGGLEPVDVTVRVVGVGDRTVGPMVVNVNDGRGVAFTREVPDGQELSFEASGRVMLAGADVTGAAFGFHGAVFASASAVHPRDFVFTDAGDPELSGDRAASFAVTVPIADAFEPGAAFPHPAAVVAPLTMAVGQTRWAFFVHVAHYAAAPDREALPATIGGRFDGSVFADASGMPDPAASVGFSWEEREPFSLRVLLPRRLASADDDAGAELREPLRLLLDRHRAAGIRTLVEYAEERWELGMGVARDPDSPEPVGTAIAGTALWPDGTPQPTPP